MTRLILSLTTIPPRFSAVGDNLSHLLEQSAEIDAINLYVARKYKRFEYDLADLPKVPDGVNLRIVDNDLGPATKVLPAAKEYRGQDVHILFCDDDKLYDSTWAQRFLDSALEHPDCCICEEGGHLDAPHYANDGWQSARTPRAGFIEKDFAYRLKRAASLGKWKPSKASAAGYVDILEGWGGVLVKPDFFDDTCFEIPDVLWTVDDVWLSGCLERRGIPIWLNTEKKVRASGHKVNLREESLAKLIHEGHGRVEANRACIEYFRNTYGIWKN
ncbi:MAG: glycosyltransferase family 2 protein [Shimia sp.]|uniref:glycosyltransferase family 2 protein n=1 Tax=Shimia sp. TaxID=1954381 RepID=UPI001B02677A|nr:glycosyltransferase family 2 protein [Shimia sp.]MBO6897267.1 glycosyltransferase family 2 protein [Shimia sp.]